VQPWDERLRAAVDDPTVAIEAKLAQLQRPDQRLYLPPLRSRGGRILLPASGASGGPGGSGSLTCVSEGARQSTPPWQGAGEHGEETFR